MSIDIDEALAKLVAACKPASLTDLYLRDREREIKPERTVIGSQWIVEIYENYIVKQPRNPNKDTAEKLYTRHQEAIALMQEYYDRHSIGEVPIPEMMLIPGENKMIQKRAKGQQLSDISDDELLLLDDKILRQLYQLMSCTAEIRRQQWQIFQDFIDIPGYNLDIPLFRRIMQSVQSRYSTNIIIDEENKQIHFVDPDFAYISTQSILRTGTVLAAKPFMIYFMRQFQQQIAQLLGLEN